MKRLLVPILVTLLAAVAANAQISVVSNAGAGTVTLTHNSTTLTGSSTAFTTLFPSSSHGNIVVSGTNYLINSCSSATSCTLTASYTGTTTSGLSYSVLQIGFPSFNSTNTCTLPNNMVSNSNHIAFSVAIIDLQAATSYTYADGDSNALTAPSIVPYKPASPVDEGWEAYSLNAVPSGSATKTLVFANTPTDNVDQIMCMELSVAGGTAALDSSSPIGALSTTSTNAAGTMTLSQASGEFCVFSAYMGGTATGVSSPWTMGAFDTSTGVFIAYDANCGSSIAMGYTPTLQGPGINLGMAFTFTASGGTTAIPGVMVR
jgi:hypothetical protein